MKKRFSALLLVIILAMSTFAGCQTAVNDTEEKESDTTKSQVTEKKDSNEDATTSEEEIQRVEISFGWWGGENRHEYTQALTEEFAKEYPGTSFVLQPNDWGGYWEKLPIQAAGGNLPTVMQMYLNFLPSYAENDMLLDLSPYVEDGTLDISHVDSKLMETGYYKGKLVTIPLSLSVRSVTYNAKALEAAGMDMPSENWTWDEFKAMAKEYTEKTGNYAIDGYAGHQLLLQLMLKQAGYDMYSEDGTRLAFDNEEPLIPFYEFWEDMVKSGCVYPPDVNVSRSQIPLDQSYIALDEAAFKVYEPNTFPGMTNNEALELHPVPYLVAGEEHNWAMPGLSFSVAADVDDATARRAVELINWWLNSETVAKVQGTDRGFPASKTVQKYLSETQELSKLQQDTYDFFAYIEDHSGSFPGIEPVGGYEAGIKATEFLEELLMGITTPEEAAKKAFDSYNEILARTANQ